jgi:hypothetical protein
MRTTFLMIITTILFSSCYSYKIFPKEDRRFTYTGERKKAFILNPQLSKEFKILKESGIYNFTNDSSADSVIKIRLSPLQARFVCGEPMIASLITLGQMPVLLPDRYQLTFTEIQKADSTQRRFELLIATRFWFWDMFAINKKFNQKAGQALRSKYYNNDKNIVGK